MLYKGVFPPVFGGIAMESKVLLEMKGIKKSFPGVRALKGVDFSVQKGEVHSLMGENGAGKSTLIKVLTGIYNMDCGEIHFDNKPLDNENSLQVQKAGISTIYQELNLIPHLSVAENIFLGREPKKFGAIDWKAITVRAKELMDSFGVNIDVKQPVKSLSTAYQQITAIVRAVSVESKLVIMDEPTSSLDKGEVELLFGIIKKLQNKGVSIVFISHRLDEIFEISNRITILRDGELVGAYDAKDLDHLKLVSLMIGRDASQIVNNKWAAASCNTAGEVILKANNLISGNKLKNASIEIREGEGVGIAGLLGSGRTEMLKVLFGADKSYTGYIEMDGKKVRLKNPTHAISSKVAFLSENRKIEGIIPNMSVKENLSLVLLPQISKMGIISKKKEEEVVETYIKRLKIKTPNMNQKIKNLSGGNQQKVLLARWLATQPKLVMMDEPTRGIDVGAKSEIEKLIKELIDEGISVLMVSSEFDELIRNSSRIVVFRDGMNVAELCLEECTENNIISCIASGGKHHIGGVC